ncbi:MAG: ABC transporter permease [Candidatus Bipolaricaulia bacterium]
MKIKVNPGSLLGAMIALAGLFLPWVQGQIGLSLGQVDAAAWAWTPLLVLTVLATLGSLLRTRVVTVTLLVMGLGGALLTLLAFKSSLAAGYNDPALLDFWLVFFGKLLVAAGAVSYLGTLSGADRIAHVLRDFVPLISIPVFLFLFWEGVVEGLRVPMAFFPRVTDVVQVLTSAQGVLIEDSIHTFVRQVLLGYALGVSTGLVVGLLVAFSPFLQRGLLPFATAFSAIPIVGLAPVLGRAFGVDWESKAAVVVIVSFFPMVINVVQGLTTVDPLEMDLMRSYAARRGQILRKLRFPNALPYMFNALKIASIIGLISVIVAEFLIPGPPEGLGQRISLSARSGRYDVTFAAIAFASLLGILFYNTIALLERFFTGWHSSFREKQ